MDRSLRRILYVSRMRAGMTDETLQRIVACAQVKNRRNDISGVLAVGPGVFAQVIEGAPAPIDETFSRICADDRHLGVKVLDDSPIRVRLFDRWSMALLMDDASATLTTAAMDGSVSSETLLSRFQAQQAMDPVAWCPRFRTFALAS